MLIRTQPYVHIGDNTYSTPYHHDYVPGPRRVLPNYYHHRCIVIFIFIYLFYLFIIINVPFGQRVYISVHKQYTKQKINSNNKIRGTMIEY